MNKIEVGVQGGGGPSRDIFGPIHITLNRVFEAHAIGDYYDGIDGLSFLFRVSGPITDFESEGVERLLFSPRGRYIKIDVVFPEVLWRGLPPAALWDRTANWLRKGFDLMLARGVRNKVISDPDSLRRDFETAIAEFLMARPDAN